jgi:hypothetical protein
LLDAVPQSPLVRGGSDHGSPRLLGCASCDQNARAISKHRLGCPTIALDHYAEHWNTTATGIVRGLVTEVLEARALPPELRIIAFSVIWGDPARYWEEPPNEP